MKPLSIGAAARRAGVRPSAIRYYDSLGLLPSSRRASGWREFDEEDVSRLHVIRTARELGFSLDEIRELLDGFSADTPPPERWRAMAAAKLPQVEAAIRRAQQLKRLLQVGMSCGCVRIEDCFLDDCASVLKARSALPLLRT